MRTLFFVTGTSQQPVKPSPPTKGTPTEVPVKKIPPTKKHPPLDLLWSLPHITPKYWDNTGERKQDFFPRVFAPYREYLRRITFGSKRDTDIVTPPTPLRPPLRPRPVDRQTVPQELPHAA